jgi:hypothetical protein
MSRALGIPFLHCMWWNLRQENVNHKRNAFKTGTERSFRKFRKYGRVENPQGFKASSCILFNE